MNVEVTINKITGVVTYLGGYTTDDLYCCNYVICIKNY